MQLSWLEEPIPEIRKTNKNREYVTRGDQVQYLLPSKTPSGLLPEQQEQNILAALLLDLWQFEPNSAMAGGVPAGTISKHSKPVSALRSPPGSKFEVQCLQWLLKYQY